MKNNDYEVDILVNDKPIKKYSHNGKIYVEAVPKNEYVIRLKNNSSNRVLSVVSVDSLNIITGKNETIDKSPGYVVNGYNSGKFDGFRISNEQVGKFKFDFKEERKSYAASKEDNSERNVGIIALRIFNEKQKPAPIVKEKIIHHWHNTWTPVPYTPFQPYRWPYYTWTTGEDIRFGDTSLGANSTYTSTTDGNFLNCCDTGLSGKPDNSYEKYSATFNCSTNVDGGSLGSTRQIKNDITAKGLLRSAQNNIQKLSAEPKGFDVGTTFGEAKESHVVEVEFERGTISKSFDIYYCTRESLIEMGIPIGNEKQINFPEPFKEEKYCTPPKNWKR